MKLKLLKELFVIEKKSSKIYVDPSLRISNNKIQYFIKK